METQLEQHPIGACYPPLSAEQIAQLSDLVRTSHDTMPPAISYDGKILDGWHYCMVCQQLGIKPKIEAPEIANPYEFVARRHEGRRHLTTGQRACVAERMATLKCGRPGKFNGIRGLKSNSDAKAVKEAAAINKVGTTSVTEARRAKEQGIPEIYQALTDGKLKPYRANEIARLPKDQQAEALKAELNGDKKTGNRKRLGQPSSKRKRPTRNELAERAQKLMREGRKPDGPAIGLSRQEVDPDFKGSQREWVDTYGHVQIMTKEQLAADKKLAAVMDWVMALDYLRKPLEIFLKTPCDAVDLETLYISKSRERRAKKVREMIELLIKAGEYGKSIESFGRSLL